MHYCKLCNLKTEEQFISRFETLENTVSFIHICEFCRDDQSFVSEWDDERNILYIPLDGKNYYPSSQV